MKTFYLFPVLMLMFLSSYRTAAQEMTSWKWDAYGIGFSTPADFSVTEKSGKAFAAGNPYVSISMRPWHDAAVTEDNLADMALTQVMDMGYSDITEFEKLSLQGFVGYGTTGVHDGIYCSIGFLLDPSTDTNFIAAVCYEEGWTDIAADILSSLYNY